MSSFGHIGTAKTTYTAAGLLYFCTTESLQSLHVGKSYANPITKTIPSSYPLAKPDHNPTLFPIYSSNHTNPDRNSKAIKTHLFSTNNQNPSTNA